MLILVPLLFEQGFGNALDPRPDACAIRVGESTQRIVSLAAAFTRKACLLTYDSDMFLCDYCPGNETNQGEPETIDLISKNPVAIP